MNLFMRLLGLIIQFVRTPKSCPHWDSYYCNCATDRRRMLRDKIITELNDAIIPGKQDMANEMNAVFDKDPRFNTKTADDQFTINVARNTKH